MFWNDAWRSGHQRGSSQNKALTGWTGLNHSLSKASHSTRGHLSYVIVYVERVQCSVFPVTTYQCTQIYEPWRRTAASSPALKKHDSTIPIILPPHNPLPKRWPPLKTKAVMPKMVHYHGSQKQ